MNDPAFNPLVKQRGQVAREAQPTRPIITSELNQCSNVVPRWWHASSASRTNQSVAVLAYLTEPAALHRWVLGLSAAAHRVPLVVAGHGMRWSGAGVKLPAARRAVQVLQPHLPTSTAIVFADGTDTAIANPIGGEAAEALARTASSGSSAVLVAGECNSWPVCYRSAYAKHPPHRQCVARRSPACFPNSGLYAGSASSLLSFLSNLIQRVGDSRIQPPERGDDQAALHWLYLTSAASPNRGDGERKPSPVTIVVDDNRVVFAGLHACKGSGALRKLRIKGIDFSLCHEGAHEPLRELARNGSMVALAGTARALTSKRPLLLHASGNHDRLARAFLGEGLQQQHRLGGQTTPRGTGAFATQWEQLFRQAETLMRHPVLLVDSADAASRGQICSIVTLSALVQRSAPSGR